MIQFSNVIKKFRECSFSRIRAVMYIMLLFVGILQFCMMQFDIPCAYYIDNVSKRVDYSILINCVNIKIFEIRHNAFCNRLDEKIASSVRNQSC